MTDKRKCNARSCSVLYAGDLPMCKNHWGYVTPSLRTACRNAASPADQAIADTNAIAFVDGIPKIKGYEEHGSLPSPQGAVCSVCGEKSHMCSHDWSLRFPQEKWEAFARGWTWPNPTNADGSLKSRARDSVDLVCGTLRRSARRRSRGGSLRRRRRPGIRHAGRAARRLGTCSRARPIPRT